MKILQICSKIPFPPKDGGSIAMNILTQGLMQIGHDVNVLAINTPKHFIRDSDVDASYREKTSYKSVFIDTSVKPVDALLNLFSDKSYNISRFCSPDFEKELISLLAKKTYDIIHLETLWVTPYVETIRKHSNAKIVLRSQNVEYAIWERLADATLNPLKKAYLKLLSRRLRNYENSILNSYDGIATITERDAVTMKEDGCLKPVIHIPFGIDLSGYTVKSAVAEFPSVFHIGAMDWRPNADGIKWFLENVWPEVAIKHPRVNLYLAGRNMPEWLMKLQMRNVIVPGEVPDSQEFINSKYIMIVPLTSGGGMRVKIIEGMALGKTIISTQVGAEGIEYEDGKDLLIADTAEEFVNGLNKCLSDRNFSDLLAGNARSLVEEKYNNQKICEKLSQFYLKLIQQ